MKKGQLTLDVRAAIVGYLLKKWQINSSSDHHLDAKVFKLWLKDGEKVLHGVKNAYEAPGFTTPLSTVSYRDGLTR
jgi:hypothetical protein